ncbi:MAG TPA: hypothetical protein PLV52_06900 [Candidatus Omnitrophota bacterium]|nr:hypothetical protein [Candidatus Omnitrophota bacterium]
MPWRRRQTWGVDAEEVDRCIDLIQEMDPPGIGARNLKDCLQIQLRRSGKEKSLEYRIVDECLGEMATGDLKRIAILLKADEKDIKKAFEALKKLNPRPGSSVLSVEADHIAPELIAKLDKKSVHLEINKGLFPRLRIYNPYENDFDIIKDPEARKFMKENMDFAKGLIDGLSRRETTLCKVAKYIIEEQKESILKPENHLKTLTIDGVAKALNFHPSTVSRAISKKYVRIDNRPVALSSLLSHRAKHKNGADISKASVKEKIRAMIKTEDPARPLKDNEIYNRLRDEGIALERRTVAKYRNALRILPYNLRKKRSL